MTSVLVIDDERSLRMALATGLRASGFDVLDAATGEEGIAQTAANSPDLIVLDLGLPDAEGHDVLRRLREFSRAPVIILSARDQQSEKLKAFEAGADDYMTKPFDPRELVARMRAALRRSPAGAGATPVVRVDELDLEIDLVRRRVRKEGESVRLTKTELALLRVLVTNPGKLLTHDYLLKTVWGAGYGGDSQYTRVYVAALRRKLGDDASSPRLILTEPGIGYRWLAE